MALAITCLIEQTWYMASETVSVSVADQDGTNTRSITSTGAWYRNRLVASGSTSGTIDSPHSLTAKFKAALNTSASRYTVKYQTDGTIGIGYSGTGTAVITWGANGAKLRRMLGFGEDATTSIPTGTTTKGTYPPAAVIQSGALLDGSGYVSEPAGVASAIAADGRVYTASSQAYVTRWRSTLGYHPYTAGARTALGEYATPVFGGTSSSIPSVPGAFYQPWTAAASSGGAGANWYIAAFMATALYSVAVCPHDYAAICTTTSNNVFVGWITPECLTARDAQTRPIANLITRSHWQNFEVSATTTISVGAP